MKKVNLNTNTYMKDMLGKELYQLGTQIAAASLKLGQQAFKEGKDLPLWNSEDYKRWKKENLNDITNK